MKMIVFEKQENARMFTKAFFEYMFGTQDFYKFIKEDGSKATKCIHIICMAL